MGTRQLTLMWILILMAGGLSACFRDASEGDNNPTSAPVEQFLEVTDEATTTLIPTLTTTPEQAPTGTLPMGGPPPEADDDEADEEDEPQAETTSDALPPTESAIPSFTPSLGSQFGDSGITPTSELPTQPVPDGLITPTDPAGPPDDCTHIVQPNQTLFSIATSYELLPEDFIAVNPELSANPNALAIGQRLSIPNCIPGESDIETFGDAPAEAIDDTPVPTPDDGLTRHIVQEGETLSTIAGRYGTTVEAIVAANPDIANETQIINIGQEIIIPPADQ